MNEPRDLFHKLERLKGKGVVVQLYFDGGYVLPIVSSLRTLSRNSVHVYIR